MDYHNFFDIFVILFILLSSIFAFSRGFIQEILSLFSWASSLLLSFYFSIDVSKLIGLFIHNIIITKILSYLIVFLVCIFAFSYITGKISSKIRKSSVGMVDRSLGFMYGIGRGFILLSLAFFTFNYFYSKDYPDWIEKSKLSYLLMKGAITSVSLFDNNNQSVISLEEKLKRKSDQLFEKSINSHLRRENNNQSEIKGYQKDDRNNLDFLIENIQDE